MIIPSEEQNATDVAFHYDELNKIYREIWGEHVHHGYWSSGTESSAEAVEALAHLVADRLSFRAGEHLCDIGCGYGAAAALFADQYAVRVTGLTLSAEQERVASARAGPLTFIKRDWLSNALPDAVFDHAYAIESSEHMADKQGFFDQAYRTVRPGGRLVVCAWLASSNPSRFEVKYLLEPICREGRLPGMGNREEYEGMAEKSGFKTARFEDISSHVRRTWSICTWRLLRRLATDASYRRSNALELACGRGGFSNFLAAETGAKVLGIDISRAQLRHASRYERENLRFAHHDIMKVDQLDESFDAIILMDADIYLPDKKAAVERISRVMKPGAAFLLIAWCEEKGLNLLQKQTVLDPFLCYWGAPGLETAAAYRDHFSNAGLRLVAEEDLNERVRPNWEYGYERAIDAIRELSLSKAAKLAWKGLPLGKEGLRLIREQFPAALYIKAAFDAGFLRYTYFLAEKS